MEITDKKASVKAAGRMSLASGYLICWTGNIEPQHERQKRILVGSDGKNGTFPAFLERNPPKYRLAVHCSPNGRLRV
ncbi:MAG: hypothetical protein PVI41_06795 [Roseobacter sp.]|jgi:hypothetical protein